MKKPITSGLNRRFIAFKLAKLNKDVERFNQNRESSIKKFLKECDNQKKENEKIFKKLDKWQE